MLAATLTACAGFAPPRAETLAALQPMPLAKVLPGRFEVELASPSLTGTFDAVCGVAANECRLQLFPDVGGKVLDLTLRAASVVAEFPGSRYEANAPLDAAEPHLAIVFAAILGELLAPVSAERVLGERRAADGATEIGLRPALGSGSVVATLAPDGRVSAYRIEVGWVRVDLRADGSFGGDGFSGRIDAPANGNG
jgi:hypothetical protein